MVDKLKDGGTLDDAEDGKGARKGGASVGPDDSSSASSASSASADSAPSTPKLTGKAYHDATRRIAAIERKLAKLEEQKADLEAQMAAHDPSDFEGLNAINQQAQAVTAESDDLEAEWLELSEQVE